MSIACARFAGSMTANCALAGVVARTRTTAPTRVRRIIGLSSFRSEPSRLSRRIGRKLQVARHVHLHAVALTNRDGWQAVQEPAHDLKACLRCRVRATGDDDRPIARSTRIARAANPLRQAADETNRSGRPERGPVVVVDFVAQARIADLIESQKL